MIRAWLSRWGWLVALSTGLVWAVNDLATRLSPDPDNWDCNSSWDYGTNALDPIGFFLMAGAILALHIQQQDRAGRLGRGSAGAAFLGAVAAGINNPIEHCAGVEALGFILWVPAIMLLTIGMLLLGVATVRTRVFPVWAGGALIIGVVASFIAGEVMVLGLAWIVVGCGMWLDKHQRENLLIDVSSPPAGFSGEP
jgi:hypothetical protein